MGKPSPGEETGNGEQVAEGIGIRRRFGNNGRRECPDVILHRNRRLIPGRGAKVASVKEKDGIQVAS